MNHSCLSLGLPALPGCSGHCHCPQPGKASSLPSHSGWHTVLCVLFWPCCGTLGMVTLLPLPCSTPWLQHHTIYPSGPFTPGQPRLCGQLCCCRWGWGQRWGQETAQGAERSSGKGAGRQGSPPPACSPPRPHRPIYYPSAIHRPRQMPPNKYPQTIGWEGPARLSMNKHEGLWTQLPLFAKWDRLCGRHLKFSRGRAVFQCPLNC